MRSIVTGLFGRKQSAGTTKTRSVRVRRETAVAGFHSLALQSLEDRLALAYTVNTVPLTTAPAAPPTFAYVIAIDDTVDASGNGRNLYMQSSTDGSPYFLIDDDPAFSNPTRLGRLLAGLGACSTVLVISSDAPTNLPGGSPAGDLPAGRGTTSGTFAQGFTFQASTTVPAERLIVDLSPVGSRISIESPWNASRGDNDGDLPGENVDWPAYRAYGGYLTVGQVALFATQVNIASNTSTTTRFSADDSQQRLSGFTSPIHTVTVNAAVLAQPADTDVAPPPGNNRIRVTGDSTATPTVPGVLSISSAGSMTATGTMSVTALGGNIQVDGEVTAPNQTYQLNAMPMPGGAADPLAYTFSTRSQSTGVQSGRIVSSGSVGITMGNPAGGTIDLRTDASRIAFQSGTSNGVPYRYSLAIEEDDSLQIDSVGSSSAPIAFKTGGDLTILGDAIRTTGDLLFAAGGSLTLSGSVNSANGNIQLESTVLSLVSDVVAGGGKSVTLRSTTGGTTTNALVRAGGPVKQPVAAASESNYALTGLGASPVVDTVTLANNDRVLLKNQTDPRENGVYVFSTAGGGVLTRATDADSSADMPPGFVVFALGGRQMGAWAFRNPNAPQFVGAANQTALSFVPATAFQAYADARLATTVADGNRLLSGTVGTIDGQALNVGDRVLVKNQSNAAENGIYVVSTGAWQRASDADSTSELRAGSYVFVTGGATLSGTGWALQNDAIQVGITNLTFTAFTQQLPSDLAPWAPVTILQNARVATTTNIVLTGTQTIDGVALVAGNVVLVKNQTNATQNGLYTVAAGAWTPVGGMPPPRGASVYVLSGTKNGGTAWQFNDSSSRLATIALNSPIVTGLASTVGLSVGMLVTGAGIPSGTTITSINPNGTSVGLSSNALATINNTPLTFTATTAVTGTTPIVFVPAAGAVTVTAATSIGGSSSLQGATALLTAGLTGGGTSSITAQTKVGRISALAPAAISITSANAIELEQVQTTTAGAVTIAADGTVTALSVSAKGTTGTPGSVSLTATTGDIVAESVTTNLGDISLTSVNDSIYVTKARFQAANVSTTAGTVSLTANRPNASPAPVISVDGRVSAQGTGGVGDVTLTSTYGQAQFTGNAVVAAADTLKIDTRNSVVSIAGTPQIAASKLDLTSQFGTGKSSYDPALGSYQAITLNRTDTGDIDVASSGSLVVSGATTITDPLFPTAGSIKFQAPDITVAGAIQPGGTATDITLIATAGNLNIDSALTSPRNITLNTTGRIATSSDTMTPLLTAAGTLTIVANTKASVLTKINTLDAQLSGTGAVLDVIEADSLTISRISTPAGGSATITAGTPSAGGSVTVTGVNMGPSGSVKITAYQDILDDASPTVADIVANRAELIATTGKIDVDTNVNLLLAQATQKNQTITVDDLGTGTTQLELLSVATTNANIAVTAQRSILATSVTTGGSISLTTTNAASDILVNNLSALGSTITLAAGGSILEATPADPTADITGTTVSLTAAAGSIDVHLDASAVAATANTVGKFIKIKDDNSLSIGNLTDGISGKTVSITVGGGLTQTMAIVAESLSVTATTGAVTLDTAANDVNSLTVSGTNAVSFQDADGLDIGADGISGGAITLKVGGALTQTGALTGTSLAITSSSGSVTLTKATNDVGSLAVTLTGATAGRTISYTDANALAIGIGGVGITGGDVDVRTLAGTGITVNAPVVAGAAGAGNGNILLKATAGDINFAATLTAKDDTITLDASNGTIILTPPGSIDCQTLVWYAKTVPALTVFSIPPNAYSTVSPNLTGSGDIEIGPTAGTLTVAGASTADGNIKISGDGVIITGLVQAGGTAKTVTVTANTGGIDFQSAGRIVNLLGDVSLNAVNGAITATNAGLQTSVTATSLAIASKSDSLLTTTVGSVSGTVSAGDLTLSETDGLVVGALTGNVISFFAGGPVTQTPGTAIKAFLLAVTNTADAITLTNAANDVDWLTVDNGNRSVAFTDINELAIGGSGITGGNSGGGVGVDITATTIGVNAPITSGAAVAGNGDIRLKATTGNIWLTEPTSLLTAKDDTITLDASNGTIIQSDGLIDCQTLVWIANTVPTFRGTPPNTYTVVAPNLTGSGDIEIGPTAGTLTVAGASTADGNITITGDTVIITGLVQTNGVGKSVIVTANNGDIDFQSDGRIVNALGSVSLDAVNGAVTATNAGSQTSVTAESLAIAAKNHSSLTTAVGAISGSVSAGNLTLDEADGVDVGNLTANVIALYAGGTITQTPSTAINAFLLAVTNTAGDVILSNADNDVDWLTIANDDRAVSFTDQNDFAVGGNGITGGDITLHAGNIIGQTVAIVGTSLTVSSDTGVLYLDNPDNDVDSLTVNNGSRTVLFTDIDELQIGAAGINGGVIVLAVGGDLTQVGEVLGFLLIVNASAGSVVLTNPDNDIDWLTIDNGNRAISFTDKNDFAVGGNGITGGDITLHAGNIIGQTVAIIGTSLAASSDTGILYLDNPGNDVDSLTVNNGDRTVLFTDVDGLEIGAVGITGGVISLTVGGDLTQIGEVLGFLLIVNASAGSVVLTNPDNDVDWLTITNDDRAISFTDQNTFAVGGNGITGGDITLRAGSTLAQTVAIVGNSLTASSDSGVVSLTNPDNDVNSLTVNNGNRPVSFTNKDELSVDGITGGTLDLRVGGNLAVSGIVTISGNATITTTAGGGVDVGPIPNSLLQAGGTLDLRNVQGQIGMQNNGRIEGSPVLVVPGTIINVGGTITTANDLDQSVATINSLPIIVGGRYGILIGANIALTQSLTVTRPLSLQGTSQAITLFGSDSVRNGLLLGATAGNSLVRDLTFAGFADDAIRLTDNTNTSILGLRIRDSGYGLTVTGTSTGTVAQGNVFNRNATGVRLLSATGVLIGGSVAGQGNTISNATREGVFAQGFCTNSHVVRNTITGTAVPYNTTQSRNLTVVP